MRTALDHVVIVVPDLDDAVAAYQGAGFTVTPGGRHDALPTANALVVFADGAYLELLAPRDTEARESLVLRASKPGWPAALRRASAIGRRFLPRLVGPSGVVDVVLRGEHLARFAGESRARGVPMSGPVAMERTRPDGERLAWSLVLPAADALPFLIEDVTPREARVPAGPASVTHANGARGVAGVTVRARDVTATAMAYADLFAATPRVDSAGRTVLALAGFEIALAPGAPEGACGVALRGLTEVDPRLRAHGIEGAHEAD